MKTSTTTDVPLEDSDSESFHSAISRVPKRSSERRISQKQPKTSRYVIEYQAGLNETQPRPSSQSSGDTGKLKSRPSSRRSRKGSITIPKRRSSLARRPSRKDPVTLHRQSCELFSSLDEMLALSRDITPLPSVSSSRTTTGHASTIGEEIPRPDAVQRMYVRIDANLADSRPRSQSQNHFSAPRSSCSHSLPTDPVLRNSLEAISYTGSTPRDSTSSRPNGNRPAPRPVYNTVISWTSDATRRREYAKIDAAHSGVRGLLRRVLPRCLHSETARRGFFTGTCDGDSVRRFRMDVPDELDDDVSEKFPFDEAEKVGDGDVVEGIEQRREREQKEKRTKSRWRMCFSMIVISNSELSKRAF
ncbi:uncharacterized protein Z518_09081 [Rhinocladiella mackenziei CBS 650.93]|uniref:Uncharacterized protein n=1 Tax=Rhinocladiella mackenziei CBS 650.93 TaxID=1442369 RepID=A0A0D2IDN7_9EURO|nr:uncharacterized protein Z518_09081 [Rhinocladiella mackenziei CBS 650.93]KIX01356.1 hypothetical protein Z518_09081 [Rhinocladiella mackenziei CBS 650.93]